MGDVPMLTHEKAATIRDLSRIKSFLKYNGLPDLGVDDCVSNFVVVEEQNGSLVGVAGLEVYGQSGLLRSVAVDERFRGQGHGRALVDRVVTSAKAKGIKTLYLLTNDATHYFEGLGFQVVDRKGIDGAVKTSLEFTEACPECAVAMRRIVP